MRRLKDSSKFEKAVAKYEKKIKDAERREAKRAKRLLK